MTKKQTELSEELREAVFEAARAGAAEAYTQNTGYVNYFKAMETLLYNYKKLAALVADEEAYCEVEYHAGRKTFSTTPQAKGFIQRKTEAEIVEEMREEKQKQFKETKSGFDSLTRAISLFEGHKEFVVIRLYYFGEDINGNPREGGTATWEEIAEELSDAGILKEIKTARRWRNKIVNDMAVCVFGIPAAVSAATYRGNVKKCAVGKHPKSEKLGGIGSGCRLRLRPLPVLRRRQSQRVARIDPNAVVVDKNIAENDRFDLFSR